MSRRLLTTMIFCMASFAATAQLKQVRQGNKLYEEKKYKEASAAYQQALQKNPTYTPGLFNLGNSLYQQQQYDAARKVMDATAKTAKDKNGKGAVNYNIGNTYMQEQKWQEAIDAYKKALRNNPQDAEAKYNLSYAQAMMKKDQQNGGGGKDNKDQKDKNDKQDKKKDQQDKGDSKDQKDQQGDKDKEKQDQQGKDQQDKNEQGDDKEQQRPQPQPSKLSQQQADQLLNALQQEEKKLQQDKMKKENGVPVKVEKDW